MRKPMQKDQEIQEAMNFIIKQLHRAADDRPRGKLGEIARLAGVDQSTLTLIKKGRIQNPGTKTLIRISEAIFKVYPELKVGNYQLIYKNILSNFADMDDIDAITKLIDILANKESLAPDLLKMLLGSLAFTYTQLPQAPITPESIPIKNRLKDKN